MTEHLLFEKLLKDNIIFDEALIVGKFAPITKGHINFIRKSSIATKKLKVVLCFDEKWLGRQDEYHQKILTLENRLNWLNEIFKDDENIEVVFIDETNLKPYPNGWAEYSDLLRGVFGGTIPENTAIFSSETGYDKGYKTHLPELQHVVVDPERVDVPISATMIRTDPKGHWKYIPECVQRHY